MARIELRRVTKRYGDVAAVKDVSVIVEDNEFFCFFGPPSSGKTTILRLILGLEAPDEGEIRIDGRVVTHMPAAERNLSMVFQNLALFPHMSAADNLAFPLVERRTPRAEIDRRLHDVAAKLHISHILEKRPGLLSGGERQRVAIGRALIRDAVGYLMDDPISALDARLREEMRVELKRLQREIGHTLIYVTHDQEEAMSIADRMAILDGGAVRQVAPPQIVYERPACRYVAALVGSPSMNFIEGALRDGLFTADAMPWSHPVAAGRNFNDEKVDAGFRPETVSVGAPGVRGSLDGTVVNVEPLGAATVIVANCGKSIVKAMVKGQPTFSVGERVGLAPSVTDLAFFHTATGERLALAAVQSN